MKFVYVREGVLIEWVCIGNLPRAMNGFREFAQKILGNLNLFFFNLDLSSNSYYEIIVGNTIDDFFYTNLLIIFPTYTFMNQFVINYFNDSTSNKLIRYNQNLVYFFLQKIT